MQEPYTSVGYLASRVPVQTLLHLRHPEAEDPSSEHPWCAWDICEGATSAAPLASLAWFSTALSAAPQGRLGGLSGAWGRAAGGKQAIPS